VIVIFTDAVLESIAALSSRYEPDMYHCAVQELGLCLVLNIFRITHNDGEFAKAYYIYRQTTTQTPYTSDVLQKIGRLTNKDIYYEALEEFGEFVLTEFLLYSNNIGDFARKYLAARRDNCVDNYDK
jgi:hypothetical protein